MTEHSLPIQIEVGSAIQAVTFSPDGKHLVSGDEEGVRVWRVEDGQQVATMKVGMVNGLAVSRDGNWIAAGLLDGDVFLWDAKTHEKAFKWEGESGILNIDFSPDSTRLVMASYTSARVWDLATRKQVQSLEHEAGVKAVKYSPDGDRVATATEDYVQVWDSSDGRLLVDIPVKLVPYRNLGLLWFKNHLCVVSRWDKIKELDTSTGTTVSEWTVPIALLFSCIAIPTHGGFIVYATQCTVTFWNTLTHSQFFQIEHYQEILSIALSPDDRFLAFGGKDKKITIQSLSDTHDSIPLPHQIATFAPDIQVDKAILDAWKQDQLEDADALLSTTITANPYCQAVLANRALVRARLQRWDAALVDAEKANDVQPSIIAYIAESMSHLGNGDRTRAYQACDIAFAHCRPSHVTFLLLIKAVIVFLAGDHVDAISRVDHLIATVCYKSILYAVQAYMHLLHGDSCMESSNYENAIKSFEHARTQLKHYGGEQSIMVSLISGWNFNDLHTTIHRRHCEALYSAGRTKDASDSLLELISSLGKESNVPQTVVNWTSDFVKRCLATSQNDADLCAEPTPLLMEWGKATLSHQSWKDALADGASFATAKFVIYRTIYERLEAIGRIADASDCLLEMANEMACETTTEKAEWVDDLKYWCGRRLEDFGDSAMSARRHDAAILQYSAALSLGLINPQGLNAKRSRARANIGLWEDALNDANEVITLDPSSPLGYERKHAALRGAGCPSDAMAAFEMMISKMSLSADPEIRERSRRRVEPAQTEAAIRAAVEDAIRESPLVLINTDSGRLFDKAGQASSFESQPIFHELVSSMMTGIDHVRIGDEVEQYYRYAMFSHKWKANEPLFDQVVHIIVYDLEESPTHVKLQMFCKTARDAGLHWAWSDTCCINKGDPLVLQEALVSMFQWYQSSTLTVVLLCDVPSKLLGDSIWNSRAWTFQEYHASKVVRFYNKDWTLYRNIDVPNHKESPEIIAEMEEATGVSVRALMALRPGLDDIREKLRLASMRQTTRIEDSAYSLLGIFSLSLSIVYGEGNKALGRLLAQLLASSGDTSILAWTGRPGSFNSCLPATISVFNQLLTTHIPPAIATIELKSIITGLRSLNRGSVRRLYDALDALPIPLFNGKRMKLPSVAFKLGDLLTRESGSARRVFRAQTDALGVVEIVAEEDLSRFKSLYLVHPWIDFLLDRQPLGNVIETIPEEATDKQSPSTGEPKPIFGASNTTFATPETRMDLASRFRLPFGRHSSTRPGDVASLCPPSTETETDRYLHALGVLARLRQPFGALLLTPDARNVAAYKRVAPETLIIVQVQEITSKVLDKLIENVRVLDVL